MAVKLSPLITFFVCVTLGLHNASGTIEDMSFKAVDGEKICTTKYTACTLTTDGKLVMERGEKGDIGFPGPKGSLGDKGERGETGSKGRPGFPGLEGLKGDPGYPGVMGMPGVKGQMGFEGPRGDKGDKGDRGFDGRPGFPGLEGLKGDPGYPGVMGMPGVKGQMGFEGPRGDKGDKGDRGFDGRPGFPGLEGLKGVRGSYGFMGPSGAKGEMGPAGPIGLSGPEGPPGPIGLSGPVGPPGRRGLSGPVGPPGAPGSHGPCPCHDTPNAAASTEHDDDDFGTSEWPAEVPCKSAGEKVASGTYYLGPTGKPMEVYCNMTSLETCIRRSKRTPECNHNYSKGAFWLNEMGINMKELYNNISVEQLTWLRDRSESVRQTLKYNCLDSVPYSKFNMSKSVKLWSWNDVMIGPYPTSESPIFYSVPESTDECKEGSTKWKSTIIELQSSNVNRLPIVNMWIGDIRNSKQKMSIESIELCFG